MKKTLLRKYAELIVKKGANVNKGQTVRIDCNVESEEFAAILAKECYKAGAKRVSVEFNSDKLTKIHYRYQSVKDLSTVAPWQEAKLQKEVDECIVRIYLLSSAPNALDGINVNKLQKAQLGISKVTKKYRDALYGLQQWCIVAVPGKDWAKAVFPKLSVKKAVEKLWEEILNSVYVTEDNDPFKIWDDRQKSFDDRCEKLNSFKLKELIYKSANGTDFRIGLIPDAKFIGGGEMSRKGIFFNPNMPTEETFTTPMKGVCEGTLVATKPLSVNGMLVENFSITFKDGKAESWKAEKGYDALTQIITMDEGSRMLGEVAIVPVDSPINMSGVLFYNTLFDENASCHVALGRGFQDVLLGYENMSKEELSNKGINDSVIHIDFMIGDETLDIVGVDEKGKNIDIIKKGKWAI